MKKALAWVWLVLLGVAVTVGGVWSWWYALDDHGLYSTTAGAFAWIGCWVSGGLVVFVLVQLTFWACQTVGRKP